MASNSSKGTDNVTIHGGQRLQERTSGFKRLHFFKMFLTDKDWNDRHRFHVEKNELHTFTAHGPGLVYGAPDGGKNLWVKQQARPDMSVEVLPGYAVDFDGQDMLLYEPRIMSISREDFYLPCTVYIVIRFVREPVRVQRLKDGSKRHKFLQDSIEIEAVARPPDEEGGELELCRIKLSADAYKITDARDFWNPRDNEIDLRYRRKSVVFRTLPSELKQELLEAIRRRKDAFLRLGGNKLLRPAAAIAHSLSVIEMMVMGDMITESNAPELLSMLNMLDEALASLIQENIDDPWVTERPDWQAFRKNADVVRSLLMEPRPWSIDHIEQIISFLNKSLPNLGPMTELYGNESLIFYEGQEPVLAREYPLSDDWHRIMVWSAEFPEVLHVDGMEWTLVGKMDMTNEDDEKKYKFKIHNAIDAWKTRQKNTYPDGAMIDETGVAHEGGYCEYEIRGVIPDTHLAVIRMMDYARADYELEFVVNDQFVGISQCIGHDRQHRWRNWPFVIPAWFVNDDVIRVKQIMTTAARDVNMFHYWFYQPLSF